MIRKSKWIEIHSPDEAASAVAARSLDARLQLVAHFLPLSAAAPDDDDEYVHQTRVATRRAMTTLTIFEHLLPRKPVKWFRKQLKKVRKAANDARDYDVLSDRLSERPRNNARDPACSKLIDWVHQQRRDAQRPIRQIAAALDNKRFRERAKRLVKKIHKRAKQNGDLQTFGQLAQVRMRSLTNKFFNCGEDNLRDLQKLHEFRVCGKHLRYAMEIFAGAFQPTFREQLYPQIEALQEQLGKINDHSVAHTHFEQWLCASNDEARRVLLRELIKEEAEAIHRLQDQFLKEWTAEGLAKLRRRFLDVLEPETGGRAVAAG